MGNNWSSQLSEEEVGEIEKETNFSKNQILRLYSRFTSLDKSKQGSLDRDDFYRIPELAINPLAERIVSSFLKEGDDERVNFRQFILMLARFRPLSKKKENLLNSKEEKLKFAFNLYDLDRDGTISRAELIEILKMMCGANITDEQIGNIADRTLHEVDLDKNKSISYDEFKTALEHTNIEQKMSIRFLD